MGKESITLSMELAKTQCYELECFGDNYSLTVSPEGCRINTRKFNTKGAEPLQSFHSFIHSFFICHIYTILQFKVGIMRLKKK